MNDRGWFRASISRNPGGAMGASWRLEYDGKVCEGQRHWAAHASATNMVASTLALREALQAYVAADRQGPLEMLGHDQAIIRRAAFAPPPSGKIVPTIDQAQAQVQALVRRIAGGVTFTWVPRDENRALPVTPFPTPPKPPAPMMRPVTPEGVDVALRAQIDALNTARGTADDGMLQSLALTAPDRFESMGWFTLGKHVGEVLGRAIQRQFIGDPLAPECVIAAMRWVSRGLDVSLATRKINLDRPVSLVAGRKAA